VIKACEKLQGQFTSGTNSITQRAAITALTTDLKPSMEMTKEFERRKKRVIEIMNTIPGLTFPEPDGAFYVFPTVSAFFGKSDGEETIKDADDLCMYLLNKAHVSTVTGRAFGEPQAIRISFANSMEKIEEAWKRITAALAKLK